MSSAPRTPAIAFRNLLLNEAKLARRSPAGVLGGLGLPLLLLIIFGSIPQLTKPSPALGGQSYFTSSFPILLTMVVVTLSLVIMPRVLVTYREAGILRRLSTTPVPPSWLLAAQVIVNIGMGIIGITLLLEVGIRKFGLRAPANWLGFLLVVVLMISAMFAIGLWIAAIARNNGVAQGLGGLLFYVMLFFGGIWIPRQLMSPALVNISDWTPFGPAVASLQNAMQGTPLSGQALLCLALYTVVFSFLAIRYFRWE